jgi:hypothetical protein
LLISAFVSPSSRPLIGTDSAPGIRLDSQIVLFCYISAGELLSSVPYHCHEEIRMNRIKGCSVLSERLLSG